jgi:hypothetical protein
MRTRAVSCAWVAAAVAGGAAMAAGVVACFDLFHSTRDLLTECMIDAKTPDCMADVNAASYPAAMDAGEQDFCDWPSPVARLHAGHACAWLSACETPMGRNAFGSCLFDALLAYDCAANPNHRVKGKAHTLWDCLWRVASCPEVAQCVFPNGPPAVCMSSLDYTACGVTAADGATTNIDVRIECGVDGAAHGENCALWGQICASDGGAHRCTGAGGLGCGSRGCFGPALAWCTTNRTDVGIDCESNGAQDCGAFPIASDAHWAACAPESDAGTCVPDLAASCVGGTAFSCRAGIPEQINCKSLLESDAACDPGSLSAPFDWTGPCTASAPECDADECTDGGNLSGCVRGATVAEPVHCRDAGLGACHTAETDQGAARRSSCAPP